MPYMLTDLVIDRVDLVDEGANSAAFIQIYKRKEAENMDEIKDILEKMKPEHAEAITKALDASAEELSTVTKERDDLTEEITTLKAKEAEAAEVAKAAEEAAEAAEVAKAADAGDGDGDEMVPECKACAARKEAEKAAASFDETETFKAMPEAAREMITKLRDQKDAAEAQVLKAKEDEANATAVAKATALKALPIEQSKLIEVLKGADDGLVDLLTTVATAIEGTVLGEVGKSADGASVNADGADAAWNKIEKAADELRAEDSKLTKQRAIATIIKTRPDMYTEYLKGGAN